MIRQAIILRRDLWLRTGNQIQSAVSAAVSVSLHTADMADVAAWLEVEAPVDVYVVNSDNAIRALIDAATRAGIPVGSNNVAHPTKGSVIASVAIGPVVEDRITQITSDLARY